MPLEGGHTEQGRIGERVQEVMLTMGDRRQGQIGRRRGGTDKPVTGNRGSEVEDDPAADDLGFRPRIPINRRC